MDKLTHKKSNSPTSVGTTPKRPTITNFTLSSQLNEVLGRAPIQPKLKIGAPNDKYEQEADRVADAVMRMPELVTLEVGERKENGELRTKPLASQITPLV